MLDQQIEVNTQTIRDAADVVYEPAHQAWNAATFAGWRVATTERSEAIRLGSFRDVRNGDTLPISWQFPLVGSGRSIMLRSRGAEQYTQALGLMQSIIVRTTVMFPQQVRYTLLDPAGNGLAFPMTRHLQRVTPGSGDVRRDLDEVVHEITRIVSTYLDSGTTSFEQIPDEMRLNEAFHFVFVADYPNRYDLRAAEALQNIAETGSRAGVYVVMHVNEDRWDRATSGFDRYWPNNSVVLDMNDLRIEAEGLAGSLDVDSAPAAQLQEVIFAKVKAAPPLDRPIEWDELVDTSDATIWSGSSDDVISATVGRHGANQPLEVWFGYREREMRPCVHGVLGAMSGAGKSTFFHNLINSLAVTYSPSDLRLYLIDGKFGVEFEPYRKLPHAEVVSLRTSPDLSRSVLSELAVEMAKRNEAFQAVGVADITAYRAKGAPSGRMPRILLIVDEYQQLFDGDRDGVASGLLKRISEQGRSSGIHMFLASQRFDSAGMLDRDAIFNNIHLRIAMQLAQAEASALTDFGPKGRRLISATCDRVGRVVVNDRAGDDDSNVPGKTALLSAVRRDALIEMLHERAARTLVGDEIPRRVIFNGTAQPDLADNPYLSALLAPDAWMTPDELEAFARRPFHKGGLGIHDWLAAERPLAVFLGQEFNVRGHTSAVLRRRPNEHLVIVGERHQERVAMVASALVSAALTEPADRVRFVVIDRSVPRTAWSEVLPALCERLAAVGFDTRLERDERGAEAAFNEIVAELERRLALGELERLDQPTLLVAVNEPDRVSGLLRVPDDYGAVDSPLGLALRRVVSQGASVGLHLVVSSSSLGVLTSVLSEKVILGEFRHRAAMQMSEDDSFVFVRSNRASALQADGDRPISALLFDSQRQDEARFKPYSIEQEALRGDAAPSTPGFLDQMASLLGALDRRSVRR